MADSKCRYKNEQFFPIVYHIAQTKSSNKKNMVKTIKRSNMFNAHWKEYAEIAHVPLNRTFWVFLTKKIIELSIYTALLCAQKIYC
jgi:hypothetical protein